MNRPMNPLFVFVAVMGLSSCLAATARAQDAPHTARADSLFQAGDWLAAAEAYETVTQEDPSIHTAWTGLGLALHRLGRYDEAVLAYARAIDLEQRIPLNQFHIARAQVALGNAEAAVEFLEKAVAAPAGGPGFFALRDTPEFEELRGNERFDALIEDLKPCNAHEYRQFDFWIGTWEVFNAADQKVGENTIQSIFGGCAVREQWESVGAHRGGSFNYYDSATERWHQNWVSNVDNPLRLSGGLDETGRMVLQTIDRSDRLDRITWTPRFDGSVRQLWEQSTDGGRTWNVVFDGKYVKKEVE